jgi:anthranilate synthase component 2/putative glutamine amidotransferase
MPLVGLTTYAERATWGVRSADVALTHAAYYELIAAAGGRPVLLPPTASSPGGPGAGASEVVAALDALVVIGGLDVDPARYGAAPDPHLGRTDPLRDESELALLSVALDDELPILAICRGHQLLNVLLGGTLVQHLPDLIGHEGHQPGDGQFADREVVCEPDSRAEAIFGPLTVVRCSHHQVIAKLGRDLAVTARSVEELGVEPVIEAVELDGARFCLGVQWHPEDNGDRRPFNALLAAC